MRTRPRWLLAAPLLTALLATGCAADGAQDAVAGFDDLGQPEMADEMADEPAVDGDVEGSRSGGGADDVVTFGGGESAGRELARTAAVTLEVEDVAAAAQAVTEAAERAGGFVQRADVQGGDFGSGTLVLRVPATSLDATIRAVGEIGLRVVRSGIQTEDLTDQLFDLRARIANLERLETELQLLLADVQDGDPNAAQLLTVFEQLNQTRGEIERLEASRAAAQDRVTLATIRVELVAQAIAPEEVQPEPEDTFSRALQTTREAFGDLGDAAIWLGVTVLPVLLVVVGVPALLLWALVRWARRRRHDRTPPPSATRTPPAPPSGGPSGPPTPSPADDVPAVPSGDREPAGVRGAPAAGPGEGLGDDPGPRDADRA